MVHDRHPRPRRGTGPGTGREAVRGSRRRAGQAPGFRIPRATPRTGAAGGDISDNSGAVTLPASGDTANSPDHRAPSGSVPGCTG
ncbi:hypothetical protein GCM10012280_47580 [Wenjunlia tyrosinilytica]|uniref:Uncharacterized protein n=1 Tax=Wenjunlia tyrosinilytica TaxID=1544741 RepID=A0A918E097_9ACTN|nr:hypothetical protein GCM10012280_47580 [Wenjunlia tyrosinilytica]